MTVPKIKRKRTKSSGFQGITYASIVALCFCAAFYFFNESRDASTTIIQEEETNKKNVEHHGGDDSKSSGVRGASNNQLPIPLVDNVDISSDSNGSSNISSSLPKTITMNTSQGDIQIKLRPDLSNASVEYIQKILQSPNPCEGCRFYRAEKPGILQGILKKKDVPVNKVLGDCPDEVKDLKHECPPHDPNCSCHGPIMKRGMIAW